MGCTFQWKGHSRAPARDQSTFQNLLRAHSLHAMNTWKHEATYLDHQGSRSRVDYILTRSNTAKGHKSETMPQLHFASWREGSRHLALIGRIDLASWRNLRSREVSNFQYDKLALVRACQPGPEQDRLKQALVPHLPLLYSGPPPSRVEALLRQLYAETFPAKQATSSLQWQNPEVQQDLERTWTIRRAIDATRIAPLPLLRKAFQIWRLKKQLRLRVKELKKASRQRRRKHWTQQLEEAEKARDAKDAYRFFRVVTTLAPRRPMERVQLRDEQGCIMTPEQEDKALAAYWNTIYGRSTVKQQAWTLQEGIAIRQEELYQALRQLKARKAVWKDHKAAQGLASHCSTVGGVQGDHDRYEVADYTILPGGHACTSSVCLRSRAQYGGGDSAGGCTLLLCQTFGQAADHDNSRQVCGGSF